MALGVTEVEGVHDHADVGGVLAGLADMGNLDELEGRLVQAALEILVAVEVAVSLLHDDVALEQETFEHLLNVEAGVVRIARAEGDVFEVEEHRHGGVGFAGFGGV